MCACRCGIDVHIDQEKIKKSGRNKDHPVNQEFSALKVPLDNAAITRSPKKTTKASWRSRFGKFKKSHGKKH